MLRLANQYSTDVMIGACDAATAAKTVAFGFEASHLRILNYAGVPLHLNLASTAAASTGDPEIAVGEVFDLRGVIVTGFSLTTSSTTTSTAADGQRVVISAWGGF